MNTISDNVKAILGKLPEHIELVAAAKTRTVEEIREAVDAGIRIIGENYIQEAVPIFENLDRKIKYHFIGHLQRNKIKKAVEIFDMIETVDSIRIAEEIDKRSAQISKIMPVLIEVNSGREMQKFGVLPEDLESLIRDLSALKHIKVRGLMTMGPYSDDPEIVRPYFKETTQCFQRLKENPISGVDMEILSMGMSGSYQTAIEEGANLIRIGTKIFGPR